MKKIFLFFTLFFALISNNTKLFAEYFTISNYEVKAKLNQDASIDITEILDVNFSTSRHGIFRKIPYKYKIQELPEATQKANRQMNSQGYTTTYITNVSVEDWNYETSSAGDYKIIKIGSADKLIAGKQQFIIHYTVLNAINFFDNHSEFYFNLIGQEWETPINKGNITIELYKSLPAIPEFFVATGSFGSKQNNSQANWEGNQQLKIETTQALEPNQGVTVGIMLPQGFLTQQNLALKGIGFLGIPALLLALLWGLYKKFGKDEDFSVAVEYYPPNNLNPSEAGIIIDDKLHDRDLTALIPYWGAAGIISIEEIESSGILNYFKSRDYKINKLKDLPADAPKYEKTMFNGMFFNYTSVLLSSLKNKFYPKMERAREELDDEIVRRSYYVPNTRGFASFLKILSIILLIGGGIGAFIGFSTNNLYLPWVGVSIAISGIICFLFGRVMPKKAPLGLEIYKKLCGFKLFVQDAELPKLEAFIKEDPNYFDKTLPYAIVFDLANKWAGKFKDLGVPPPNWYCGGSYYNTQLFMSDLDNTMRDIGNTLTSAPSSSGTSGGSFSGGGGFSGGGFGGGGGGSW